MATLLAVLAMLTLGSCRQTGNTLPSVGAASSGVTTSGISSGAYMAGQLHMAHGRMVSGVAIIAGGPYGCAESVHAETILGPGTAFLNLGRAMNGCMRDTLRMLGVPSATALVAKARSLAAADRIDPLDTLKGDRVFLFSGTADSTVLPSIVAAAGEYYRLLGVTGADLRVVDDIAVGHAFPTLGKGEPCDSTREPYIVDCDFDLAAALLRHLLDISPLAAEKAPEGGPPAKQALELRPQAFDQRPFTAGLDNHGLDDSGLVYVPAFCTDRAGCRVHVAFHGCGQSRTRIGDAFATDTGFLRWAEAHRLIMLFPQVAPNTLNPLACWDWWGYTGRDYLTRSASQIRAVHRMLLHLAKSART